MPQTRPEENLDGMLSQGTALLKTGRSAEALNLAQQLFEKYPRSMETCLLASHAAQQLVSFDDMLAHAERAVALAPAHLGAQFRLMECQLYCGRFNAVLMRLRTIEAQAGSDALLLRKLGEYYSLGNRHGDARRCYRRAVDLQPDDADAMFALASAEIAVGHLETAEELLDQVIRLDPHDYDAYRNRATLRRQTAANNHLQVLHRALDAGVRRPAGEAQLCYALAKEYEDVGDYETSFAYLKRGADTRRRLLSYRVENDLAVLDKLRAVFDEHSPRPAAADAETCGPVFVLGLPRSGTTLVERILSSHSQVDSLGEINDFAYGLMHSIGAAGSKTELVERSIQLDFKALGQRYLAATRAYGLPGPRLIDKTPLNFLYIGLIRLALPGARIVHVHRNPMDSCYGMYRTLFRAGYPFSYDLDDLARYYIGYRRLMDHWRRTLPGAFLDVSYERLVDAQEDVSREILDWCQLPWEPACLAFHENAAPVATASSAQVRRPVYRDALQRWRRYESQLRPLAEQLSAAGIDLDAPP
ncbi:MAG: sulfotransferase [Gammaproteobacteria bacterium]|nr:sulfotransferase [Gammaproteobacteria bacterium]